MDTQKNGPLVKAILVIVIIAALVLVVYQIKKSRPGLARLTNEEAAFQKQWESWSLDEREQYMRKSLMAEPEMTPERLEEEIQMFRMEEAERIKAKEMMNQ